MSECEFCKSKEVYIIVKGSTFSEKYPEFLMKVSRVIGCKKCGKVTLLEAHR